MSEEGPTQDAGSITATETPTSTAVNEPVETIPPTEIPMGAAVILPMTTEGIAEPTSEVKPVSTIPPEDVGTVVCCACCAACTLFVVCLPCEIVGFVVRCLLLPFKCAILCCCPPDEKEKPPVPGSGAAA